METVGRIAKKIIVAALFVLAVFVITKYSFKFGSDIFYQAPLEEAPGRDIEFVIKEGDGGSEIAERLKNLDLITNEPAFRVMTIVYGAEFYPGEYTINTSMTTKELLDAISLTEEEIKERQSQEETKEEEAVLGGGAEG
ncbi:MAG: aminodeoxychorismate lyase [Eubacteriales bacterium]|nr:aminodeoxychorismate lyase [Eubacteriales bacterium]